MPPKPRISKDMVVDAALEVVRLSGADSVNARTVAEKLGCSTQPVMYHFATVEELKREAYERLDWLHTEYLMNQQEDEDPLLGIGLNYLRFAVREPCWFRFLFQSGYARERNVMQMIESEELRPVLEAMQAGIGIGMEQTKEIFVTLALFVHGYASIIANNGLEYDEILAAAQLERVFDGAMMAVQKEELK